ncbi:hypothetical protein NEISICOT_03620 [Neisseria sicca ATCC 29256]|uniref:Uncharacterized protein n=2 Tax=Neisseria TaxID=482 RepID=C6MAP8_NEISI|nr:hypothetical protein NEISICOT_03620 [Neisseria sicca ATCC 29256]
MGKAHATNWRGLNKRSSENSTFKFSDDLVFICNLLPSPVRRERVGERVVLRGKRI